MTPAERTELLSIINDCRAVARPAFASGKEPGWFWGGVLALCDRAEKLTAPASAPAISEPTPMLHVCLAGGIDHAVRDGEKTTLCGKPYVTGQPRPTFMQDAISPEQFEAANWLHQCRRCVEALRDASAPSVVPASSEPTNDE